MRPISGGKEIRKEPTKPSQGRIFKIEVTARAKALRSGSWWVKGQKEGQWNRTTMG